jgi:F-type H+-transporting ATPase subunit a
MEAIEHPPLFVLPGIPNHVTYTWIVMAVLIGISFAASRRLELVPRGLQNFMEIVLEQFLTLLDDVVGHEGRRYFPLIATLGLFILTSNLIGLIPGLMAPTSSLNTTAACALIVFFTYHWIGIRKQGVGPYLRHLCGPVLWLAPLMFIVEIFSHLARPLSLALRLFGNMTGGHILLAVIFSLTLGMAGWVASGSLPGLLIGIPGSALLIAFTTGFLIPLKILVAFLQAFIFCMLSMLYIAGAIEEAEHH